MWNQIQDNHLGGKYDEHPGDRRIVTNNPNQMFEPVVVQFTIFNSEVTFKSLGGRNSSEKDSAIALLIERTIKQLMTPTQPKEKQLEDGKTIDV